MEFIIIGVISLISMAILKYIFDYNMKKLKDISKDEQLDKIAMKYPENIELCKSYLKRINNEKVEIEEDKNSNTSMYIVATNKILISNIQNTYTRIQTIAHECLHSIQPKKLLLFNFIFSNIYIIYFVAIVILALIRQLPHEMLFLNIFLILSLIYYSVRVYLENDAMIKARYLAKEYMEDEKISTKEETEKLIKGFDKINTVGIKCVNCHFFLGIMMKTFILVTIFLLR